MENDSQNRMIGKYREKREDERQKALASLKRVKEEIKRHNLRYRLRLDTAYICCTHPEQWIEAGAEVIEVLQENGKRKRGRPKKILPIKRK